MLHLQGILSVLCTPFQADGSVDEDSFRRLVEHNLSWGVDGLVCFGLASEIYKLSDLERERLLDLAVEVCAGAVPVIAGTEHSGTETAAMRSRQAARAGASAIMVYPPTFVKPDADQVLEYYDAIAEAAQIPIIIQDAPAWTGVPLPVDLLAKIRRQTPSVQYVKVEAPPTSPKMKELQERDLVPIGGYGALHLYEELHHGIAATMPGCSLPGFYLDVWTLHREEREDECWELFARGLPLLAFQLASLDLFVSVQKTLLQKIGLFASARLRRPGREALPSQVEWLEFLLEKTRLDSYLAAVPEQ